MKKAAQILRFYDLNILYITGIYIGYGFFLGGYLNF